MNLIEQSAKRRTCPGGLDAERARKWIAEQEDDDE